MTKLQKELIKVWTDAENIGVGLKKINNKLILNNILKV